MNLLTRLLRREPEITRYSWDQYQNDVMLAFQGQRYMLSGGSTGFTKTEDIETSFTGYINGLYKSNGIVFAIILARMLLFTEGRFCWFEIQDNGEDGRPKGRAGLEVLEKPWPNGGTAELLARMEQDGTLGGNFFAAREPDRIRRLRPDWVTIVLTAPPAEATRSDVAGYWYHPGRTYSNAGAEYGKDDEVYLPDEVCHWSPIPDPDAQYRGMSWLTPVIREVMADKAARDHKLAFFENGAQFGAIISAKESLTNQQYKEWKANFEGVHTGAASAYKTLFLASPVDTSVTTANMQQLDFKVVQGAGETRLCAAGGVPPIIVGLSEGLASATYSNYGMARRKFGDHWAHPQWRSASQALAALVDPPEEEDLRLGVNTKGIAFLREDAKDLATIQQIKASTLSTLIMGGFTPESSVAAVEAEDLSLLEHTGLTSVQLVPPGTAEGSVEDEEAGEEYDALLDEFADDGMERARYNVRNPEGSVGGGRFRRLSDAIVALLRDSDGDDPLEDFTQPQLKKAAADLGLTEPRKRYTAKQLKLMLAQHARGGKAPAKKAAPARRAFDPAEVAGQVASQKSESEVIGLLASDPTLTSAKLRKVAEYLGIDVPDEVKSKSQLQLLIAEEEASQRDLPFEAPAKKATPRAPAKKAAPRRLTDTEADSLSTAQFSADGSVVTSNARTRANLERDGFVDERGRITDAGRAALAAHQPSTFDAGDTAKELFGLKDDDEGLRGALEGLSKAQLRAVFQVMRHPEPGSRATSGRAGFALPPASQRADAPALREALFAALTRDRRIREDSADRREQQARQRQADIDTAQHYAAVAGELAEYLDAEADPEVVARRLRQEGRKRGIADEVEPIAAAVEQAREIEVENRVRAAYRALRVDAGFQGFVSLADIRDALGEDYPRGEIDRVLIEMAIREPRPGRPGHARLVPVEFGRSQRDRDSAVSMGGGKVHALSIDDPSDRPDARTLTAALLADHGITQDGAAGDSGRFTPGQHTPIGAPIRQGAAVEVVRPGFTLERDGERIRLSKAVVEEAGEADDDIGPPPAATYIQPTAENPVGAHTVPPADMRASPRNGETVEMRFGIRKLRGVVVGQTQASTGERFLVIQHEDGTYNQFDERALHSIAPAPGNEAGGAPDAPLSPRQEYLLNVAGASASGKAPLRVGDEDAARDLHARGLVEYNAKARTVEITGRGQRRAKSLAPSASESATPDPLSSLRTLDPEAARDALDLRTVPQLKDLIRQANERDGVKLAVSGRKRELVDRLVGHVHPQAGSERHIADSAVLSNPDNLGDASNAIDSRITQAERDERLRVANQRIAETIESIDFGAMSTLQTGGERPGKKVALSGIPAGFEVRRIGKDVGGDEIYDVYAGDVRIGTVRKYTKDVVETDSRGLGVGGRRRQQFDFTPERGGRPSTFQNWADLLYAQPAPAPGHLHPGDSPTESRVPAGRPRLTPAEAAQRIRRLTEVDDILEEIRDLRAGDVRALAEEFNITIPVTAKSAAVRKRHIAQSLAAHNRRTTGGLGGRSRTLDEDDLIRAEDEPEDDDPGEPDDEQRARAQARMDEIDDDGDEPEDEYEAYRAAGMDTHLGGEQLHLYWTKGAGLRRWAASPHPWTALYRHLTKHVGSARAKRMASAWFHEVFGIWSGERKGSNPVGPG